MATIWIKSMVLGAAIVAVGLLTSGTANAQAGGYGFGIGMGYGVQNSVRFLSNREDLPYFAKFPPVYYGDMVRRPYGFSPYALPPGIMPAEYSAPVSRPCAQTIHNPFVTPAVPAPPAPAAPPALEAPADPVEGGQLDADQNVST